MRISVIFIFICAVCTSVFAQRQPDAAQIKLKLQKLNFLGSVLYVAAHPDDENTRAIAYLANERLAATAYLSMTRGDGGQNLIGPEMRDLLGLIRTQELLAARRIDGGEQFFTRANDFGFSKSAKETFEIWNKQEVLSDVVKIYRTFQPDVILTRFPPNEKAGHGQHTASSILAQEAFDVSGDANQFTDQVSTLGVWKPVRLFINTGRFFYPDVNENTPGITTIDIGLYNPLLGKSYSEMAAESRTQHKSQGFGASGRRGEAPEYFEFVKGEKHQKDFFDNINTTWTRIPGGAKIQTLVEKAIHDFDPEKPSAIVPQLLIVRKEINALAPSVWRNRKLKETEQLIKDCLGLFVEVSADQFWMAPGELLTASFELVNRSDFPVSLLKIKSDDLQMDSTLNSKLEDNKLLTFKSGKQISSSKGYSDPYWLREDHTQGLFKVPDAKMTGKAQNDPAITVQFTFSVDKDILDLNVPVAYKWTDPVKGELGRPLEVVPPMFVNLSEKVIVFNNQDAKPVQVLLKSSSSNVLKGNLRLDLPGGWKSEPATIPFELSKKGEEATYIFSVIPAKEEGSFLLNAIADVGSTSYNYSVQTIQYDHIPTQTLLPKAKAKLVRVNLKKEGSMIGYIKGAGDEIPSALRNIGYEVWEMKNEEITAENLKKIDAIVLGVRALNTNERISFFMPTLFDYVKTGGTLVVQYNTNSDLELDKDKIAPLPLQLSRDRVTEEKSEVRLLRPDHPVLNVPNKVTTKDFDGWVQERGLYFPNQWDAQIEPILSMNDTGEQPRDGSLLVAHYGEGYYIYTGLSFFRELPEGVSGAYKLFANIVSLGKTKKPQNQKVKSTR